MTLSHAAAGLNRRALRAVAAWSLLVLTACASDDGTGWQTISSDLSGALFSVTGTSERDVWIAGAERTFGRGPILAQWDGEAWTLHETGLARGDLSWVHAFAGGTVFAAGSDGRILRRTGSGRFEIMTTPAKQRVWGIWGVAPDDMWAVGGGTTAGAGFIWRYDGKAWTAVTVGAGLPRPSAWYKAWGTARDKVWICGTKGALLRWDGKTLAAVTSGTTRTLLTIHGRADGSLVTAVGGQFTATLVESSAGRPFRDVTPAGDAPLQTFGIFHRGVDSYAVGLGGLVLRRTGTSWVAERDTVDVFDGLHGVWIDPAGGVWAVGGRIVAPPFTGGTLVYKGPSPPAPIR